MCGYLLRNRWRFGLCGNIFNRKSNNKRKGRQKMNRFKRFRITHIWSERFLDTFILEGDDTHTNIHLNTGTKYTKVEFTGNVSVFDYVDIISNDERFEVTEI